MSLVGEKIVQFNVVLTFPNKDLELDFNRYTGNEPNIMKALLQKGLANEKGYLTQTGIKYFEPHNEESRFMRLSRSTFLSSCFDNYDWTLAYRDYAKYVLTCPRKVFLSFDVSRTDLVGDPPRFASKEFDPLLLEHGFVNERGCLTVKALNICKSLTSP